MSHCPCTPSPMSPIQIYTLLWQCASPMCPIVHVPITHVAYCPCAPLPYSHVDLEGSCCISHMPHHSCSPSPMCPITLPLVLMCPIAHVAYCPCILSPMSPIQIYTLLWQCAPSPMCPIVHVSHCSCAPSPMCPIPQGASISIFGINQDTHLPTFPIAHMSKKM